MIRCPTCNSTKFKKIIIDKELVQYCEKCGYSNKKGLSVAVYTEPKKIIYKKE